MHSYRINCEYTIHYIVHLSKVYSYIWMRSYELKHLSKEGRTFIFKSKFWMRSKAFLELYIWREI